MAVAPSSDENGTLGAARAELDAAARELERLTQTLTERTATVERMEVLADTLLDLLPLAALVVEEDGRIAALSRGAVTQHPELSDALGKTAVGVLPDAVVRDIHGYRQGGQLDGTATQLRPLPGGSLLVILSDRSELGG